MAVTPSTPVAINTLPDTNDVWALSLLMRAQWAGGVRVHTAWKTNITVSDSGLEKRVSLQSRPNRVMDTVLQIMYLQEMGEVRGLQRRMAIARSLIPLYSDHTTATSITALDTVINCDTRYRRFCVGARIGIAALSSNGSIASSFEVARISSLTDSTITITLGVTGTYPRARIYPLIEINPIFNSKMTGLTDTCAALSISGQESGGKSSLDPLAGIGTFTGFPTLGDLPIFNIRNDWSGSTSPSVFQYGDSTNVGLSPYFQKYGLPFDSEELSFTFLSRDKAWNFLKFFDACAGRLLPFWFLSRFTDYQFISYDSGTSALVVQSVGQESDWNFRPYIGLEMRDGTIQIRKIASIARATYDTLTLAGGTLDMSGTVRRCTLAYPARFDNDELVENWQTDGVMRTSVKVISAAANDFTVNTGGGGSVPGYSVPDTIFVSASPVCSDGTVTVNITIAGYGSGTHDLSVVVDIITIGSLTNVGYGAFSFTAPASDWGAGTFSIHAYWNSVVGASSVVISAKRYCHVLWESYYYCSDTPPPGALPKTWTEPSLVSITRNTTGTGGDYDWNGPTSLGSGVYKSQKLASFVSDCTDSTVCTQGTVPSKPTLVPFCGWYCQVNWSITCSGTAWGSPTISSITGPIYTTGSMPSDTAFANSGSTPRTCTTYVASDGVTCPGSPAPPSTPSDDPCAVHPAPCSCPSGLADMYTGHGLVDVQVYESQDGDVPIGPLTTLCTDQPVSTVNSRAAGSTACNWFNTGPETDVSCGDLSVGVTLFSLTLIGGTGCYWRIGGLFGGRFGKYSGITPIGSYTGTYSTDYQPGGPGNPIYHMTMHNVSVS